LSTFTNIWVILINFKLYPAKFRSNVTFSETQPYKREKNCPLALVKSACI
jgi:hypothetical protein